MELLREEKLRNSNPVGILQELTGDWITINRSAIVRCHCCHQVYMSITKLRFLSDS